MTADTVSRLVYVVWVEVDSAHVARLGAELLDGEVLFFWSPPQARPMMMSRTTAPTTARIALREMLFFGGVGGGLKGWANWPQLVPSNHRCTPLPPGSGYQPGAGFGGAPGTPQQRDPAPYRRRRYLPRPQRPDPTRRRRAGRTTRRMGRITPLPRPRRPQQIPSH